MARTKVKAPEGTKPNAAENVESTENDSEETDEASAGSDEDDDEVLTPLPVKAQPKAPSKKPRRNLGGVYKTKNQIRYGGEFVPTGTTLTLSDEEARHYLKFGAVEAVEEDED
ncbi:MAG: hypothetical protein WC565_01720 [Parcubacteria group bacterium]